MNNQLPFCSEITPTLSLNKSLNFKCLHLCWTPFVFIPFSLMLPFPLLSLSFLLCSFFSLHFVFPLYIYCKRTVKTDLQWALLVDLRLLTLTDKLFEYVSVLQDGRLDIRLRSCFCLDGQTLATDLGAVSASRLWRQTDKWEMGSKAQSWPSDTKSLLNCHQTGLLM